MADFGQVGSAFVELEAKDGKLRAGLDKAKITVGKAGDDAGKRFGEKFGASAKRYIGPAIAGAFSVAAIRGFLNGAEKAIDSLDRIAKQADKLGISTDVLQEFRVAADLSGVSVQTFEMAFQRFTRRSAEAARGTGEAKDALKELGVSLRDSNGQLRPAEDLLGDVADAMQGVGSQADRVRLAMKLFDSEGVALVNMLMGGKAALDGMRQQARELGIVIDESLIRRSVVAKDEIFLLSQVIDAQLTVALADLAPVLLSITGALASIASATGQAYKGFQLLFGISVSGFEVMQITPQLEELRGTLDDISRTSVDYAKGILPASQAATIRRGIEDLQEAAALRGDVLDEINAQLLYFANQQTPIVAEIERLEAQLGKALLGQQQTIPDTKVETTTTINVNTTANDVSAVADQTRDLASARTEDAAAIRMQASQAAAAASAHQQLASALERTGEELIRAAFEGGNFIQILADLLISILRIQANSYFSGGGGGLFGSLLGSVFGGIGGALGGGGSSAMFPLNTGQLTGFADGGLPPVGQFSLVGEQGPELAYFGSQARIFSNDDLKAALSGQGGGSGGGAVSVNMNISTPDVGSFRRSQSQVAAELGRMIRNGQARQT